MVPEKVSVSVSFKISGTVTLCSISIKFIEWCDTGEGLTVCVGWIMPMFGKVLYGIVA